MIPDVFHSKFLFYLPLLVAMSLKKKHDWSGNNFKHLCLISFIADTNFCIDYPFLMHCGIEKEANDHPFYIPECIRKG